MKNKLIIISIFLIGIVLRLYPASKHLLWLDEVYSLYFASNFSVKDILFHLPETHPGGYYFFLKILLYFSQNTFFLRTISSIVPELIGCYIVYRLTRNRYLLLALLFNPFFIHLSWQLRMYGITFLLSILLFSLFYKTDFINSKKFFVLSLISVFFSFSLIIPIFYLCLYSFFQQRKKYIIFLAFLIFLEFFILKGFLNYKQYVELASWVNSPNFFNIPSVFLSSIGILTDVNNAKSTPIFLAIIFFLIFTPLIYFLTKSKKLFLYFFTLPLILVILISLLFPFLSQHFFFFLFIPKISVFIPRFLLPLFIFFFIFLFDSIPKKISIPILITLILLWVYPYQNLNLQSFYPPVIPKAYPSNTIILPPWENLRLNKNFSKTDLEEISKKFNSSLLVEQKIINFSSSQDCLPIQKYSQIIYIDQPTATLEKYQTHIKKTIENCSKSP